MKKEVPPSCDDHPPNQNDALLNHFADIAHQAGIRYAESPERNDEAEFHDVLDASEPLRTHAEGLHAKIVAHRRVAVRLDGTKKPTQLDVSLVLLKDFMALNDTPLDDEGSEVEVLDRYNGGLLP